MIRRIGPALFCALCAAFLTLPFLGDRPFFTRGEGREALVAQSMLEQGEWLVGVGYGGIVPSKPPTLHWLAAIFSLPLGSVSEFTMRLPSSLSSIFFIWYFVSFLARRKGDAIALLSGLILITTLEWGRAATNARVDMLLASFLGAGFLALYSWRERELKGIPIVAILCIASAALTKGPVAIALPGLIFGLFLLWEKFKLGQVILAGLTVFVPATAIAGSWYLAAYLERGSEFFSRVYYENFARLTSSQEDQPHRHSAFYLYGVFLLGLMPWVLWLLPNARRWFKKPVVSSESLHRYFGLVILVFLIFFSIPSGKRSVYLLPVFPFASYFLAITILANWERFYQWVKGLHVALISVLAIVLCGVIVIGTGTLTISSPDSEIYMRILLASFLSPTAAPFWFAVFAFTIAVGLWSLVKKPPHSPIFFGLLYVLIFAAANGSLVSRFGSAVSPKQFAEQGEEWKSDTLYSFQNEFYALSFYLRRPILRLTDPQVSGGVVFLYEDNLEELKAFMPEKRFEFVARSIQPIERIGKNVVAVRIESNPI